MRFFTASLNELIIKSVLISLEMGPPTDILLMGVIYVKPTFQWTRNSNFNQTAFGIGPLDVANGECVGFDRAKNKLVNYKCGEKKRVMCE
jgi:hypothetical protein